MRAESRLPHFFILGTDTFMDPWGDARNQENEPCGSKGNTARNSGYPQNSVRGTLRHVGCDCTRDWKFRPLSRAHAVASNCEIAYEITKGLTYANPRHPHRQRSREAHHKIEWQATRRSLTHPTQQHQMRREMYLPRLSNSPGDRRVGPAGRSPGYPGNE